MIESMLLLSIDGAEATTPRPYGLRMLQEDNALREVLLLRSAWWIETLMGVGSGLC